jgi:hypothetical protein
MIVLKYVGSQCTKFHTAGWTCSCFTSIYLESCIWNDVILQWIRQTNSIKFCAKLGESAMETCQRLDKRTGIKSWAIHWESKLTKTEKGDKWRAKSRACPSFSLTSRGLFSKNSSWQAKHSILHTTVTFYCDCVKMCEDFPINFGDKRTDCCITATHYLTSLFTRESLTKNHRTVNPTPTLLFCFSDCRDDKVPN